MRVYARIFENMLVYAFMRYMLIQNKYKLCFDTFLLTLLLILMYNFNFEKYVFMLVFPSLVMRMKEIFSFRFHESTLTKGVSKVLNLSTISVSTKNKGSTLLIYDKMICLSLFNWNLTKCIV